MQKHVEPEDFGPVPRRRSSVLAVPLIIFAGMAAVFMFALRAGDPSKLPSALIGKKAPTIELSRLEDVVAQGQTVGGFSTADLGQGQVVVVNFWASWCAPCVQEHPMLIALAQETKVPVYGVNHKDQPEAARRFLTKYGNPFKAIGVDGNGRAAIEWGVYGMPETFVINGRGEVVYKHVGPITLDTLQSKVIPAVRAAAKN
jgi:cytochrome c biogenesis protein CcmG, thiol:disulfide interchange protein DsbE